MPSFDLVVESPIQRSIRLQQLEAMFDVPPDVKSRCEWHVDLPIEDDWQIGLIVGPSGSGKTQIARRVWPDALDAPLEWRNDRAVIDCFDSDLSMESISAVCSAVGFNTIPSWRRPFHVLSNGERFRVELARRMIEGDDLTVIDEFTSVVDRQVAHIASHAVQKYIRRTKKQFVAVSCHYDIIDWLQPDWLYDPSTRHFARRELRRRPELNVSISPVPYSAWHVFSKFHYLTASLNRGARCFGLFVDDRMAAFIGMLNRPSRSNESIMGVSRAVTLPDFQGIGLIFVLIETVASWYRAIGLQVHMYPAHPSFIRSFDRSPNWELRKRPGRFLARIGASSTTPGKWGGRPCAVFRYRGPISERTEAKRVLSYFAKSSTVKIDG